MSYFDEAERLWRGWLDGKPGVPSDLASGLDLSGLPEPYLIEEAGDDPLYVLLTNPGGVMGERPLQRRESIVGGLSPVNPTMRYSEVSAVLSAEYRRALGGAAGGRIAAMDHLASAGGWTGLAQFETVPWHSPDFGPKYKLIAATGEWSGSRYVSSLREVFVGKPAIHVSASGPINLGSPKITPWLEFVASVIGLELSNARVVPLRLADSGTVSIAALIDGTPELPKVITLRMGVNGLPNAEGRAKLLQAIGR